LLADDLETQHVLEEAQAFFWAWGEQLDVREVGDIVDWLVDVCHSVAPDIACYRCGADDRIYCQHNCQQFC
jgi:hypothetical protein